MTRLLLLALVACGPKVGPNGVTPDDAVIYMKANVRDAQVYIDGRFVAPLYALGGGVAVEPGKHRIELRREDYFSTYVELDLHRAEKQHLALEMAAILP